MTSDDMVAYFMSGSNKPCLTGLTAQHKFAKGTENFVPTQQWHSP
jgi:hypothetical protein